MISHSFIDYEISQEIKQVFISTSLDEFNLDILS